jgi:hypothetical protein
MEQFLIIVGVVESNEFKTRKRVPNKPQNLYS